MIELFPIDDKKKQQQTNNEKLKFDKNIKRKIVHISNRISHTFGIRHQASMISAVKQIKVSFL